jgi:hypothetical protein
LKPYLRPYCSEAPLRILFHYTTISVLRWYVKVLTYLTVSGGEKQYKYSMVNEILTRNISYLATGIFHLFFKDKNNISSTASVTINKTDSYLGFSGSKSKQPVIQCVVIGIGKNIYGNLNLVAFQYFAPIFLNNVDFERIDYLLN